MIDLYAELVSTSKSMKVLMYLIGLLSNLFNLLNLTEDEIKLFGKNKLISLPNEHLSVQRNHSRSIISNIISLLDLSTYKFDDVNLLDLESFKFTLANEI